MKKINVLKLLSLLGCISVVAPLTMGSAQAQTAQQLVIDTNPSTSTGGAGLGGLPNTGDVSTSVIVNSGETFYLGLPRSSSSVNNGGLFLNDFRFGLWAASLDTQSVLTVSLFDGSPTAPGAAIAGINAGTLAPTIIDSGAPDLSTITEQVATLTATPGQTLDAVLAPNTTYWFAITNNSSSAAAIFVGSQFGGSTAPTYANNPGFPFINNPALNDPTLVIAGTAGVNLDNFSSPYFDLTADITPVPEPSSLGLLLSASACAGFLPRFRRKA